MDSDNTSRVALAAGVYNHLKDGIVEGRYRPNERLVEAAIAEALDISRTPVREALHQLASDGLVVSRRRGWVVHDHALSQIQEIYEIRMALEGYAARLAAGRASEAELELIDDLSTADVQQTALADRKKLVVINNEFHAAVLNAAHSPRLVELAQAQHQYYFNFRLASLYSEDEARRSLADHRNLTEALIARDADRAEIAARDHLSAALHIIAERGA